MAGDSAHHKDSITARGIGDAFLQAEMLTNHIGQVLHDEDHLDRALKSYAEDLERMLMDG